MDHENELTAGEYLIDLGSRKLILKPNIEAAIEISRSFGGLRAAVGKCLDFDFDTVIRVIEIGSGGFGQKEAEKKKVRVLVFEVGLQELIPICIDYINCLSNGGKPLDKNKEEEDGDDEKKA